ncbi:MAG: 4-hydroxy-tetrahydrodipicolinate synthase [Haliangiales bacterium]
MKDLFTVVVTPFLKQQIDWDSFASLIDFQLQGGIGGLWIAGTTGEAPTLSNDEKQKLVEFALKRVEGRVPVFLGVGWNDTARAIQLALDAERWGADGISTVVPYYNLPPQRGLIRHFTMIASVTRLPVFLINVPGRTVVKLDTDTIARLSGIRNIVGLKEVARDPAQTAALIKRCEPGFRVLAGNDRTSMDLLRVGATGISSVVANVIPGAVSQAMAATLAGDADAPAAYRERYMGLIESMFLESNPIPAKAALKEMGVIRSDELRLPLVSLSDDCRVDLRRVLKSYGLLPG